MIKESILPDFQEFLRSRKLVPDKNISYYAHWVSKFLHYCNKKRQLDHNKLVMEFMDSLQKDNNIPDWQIHQAQQAVQLYLVNFKGKTASEVVSLSTDAVAKSSDVPDIIKEMKRIIRLKHYSYSTERTYHHWANRFFQYVRETKGNAILFSSDDIKQYLSHLAIKQHVSASMQNQALLFAISS